MVFDTDFHRRVHKARVPRTREQHRAYLKRAQDLRGDTEIAMSLFPQRHNGQPFGSIFVAAPESGDSAEFEHDALIRLPVYAPVSSQ